MKIRPNELDYYRILSGCMLLDYWCRNWMVKRKWQPNGPKTLIFRTSNQTFSKSSRNQMLRPFHYEVVIFPVILYFNVQSSDSHCTTKSMAKICTKCFIEIVWPKQWMSKNQVVNSQSWRSENPKFWEKIRPENSTLKGSLQK